MGKNLSLKCPSNRNTQMTINSSGCSYGSNVDGPGVPGFRRGLISEKYNIVQAYFYKIVKIPIVDHV